MRDLLAFINEAPSATKRTARHAQRFCLEARRRGDNSFEAHFYPREGSYRARFRIESERWVKTCECGCADDPCVHTVALAQMLTDAAERGTTVANNIAGRGELVVPASSLEPPTTPKSARPAATATAAKAAASVLSSITRTPKLSATSRAHPSVSTPPPPIRPASPSLQPAPEEEPTEAPLSDEAADAAALVAEPVAEEPMVAPPEPAPEPIEEEVLPEPPPTRAERPKPAPRETAIQRWLDQIEACLPEPTPSVPAWRNLRLKLLDDGGAVLEGSLGEAFARLRRQELETLDFCGETLPPQARTLLRACVALRHVTSLEASLPAGGENLGRLLRILVVDPLGRAAVVDDEGLPLELLDTAAAWGLEVHAGKRESHLRCQRPAGVDPQKPIFRLPGQPLLAYCGRHVFPAPAQLPDHEGLDPFAFPTDYLDSTRAIYGLRRLGVILPADLLEAHPVRPLRPRISLLTAEGSSQPLRLRYEAVDAEGESVYRAEGSGWTRQREDVWAFDPQAVFDLRLEDALANLAQPKSSGDWALENQPEATEAVVAWIASLPSQVQIERDETARSLFDPPLTLECNPSLRTHPKQPDLGLLRVALDFPSALKLSPEGRSRLAAAAGKRVYLPGKGWLRADCTLQPAVRERFQRLGLEELQIGEPVDLVLHWLQIHAWVQRGLLPAELLTPAWQERRRELEAIPQPTLPEDCYLALRGYQQAGFEFLVRQTRLGLGAILADDRGLGKSVQAIAWFSWLQHQTVSTGAACRILVVCPQPCIAQWLAEASRFAPTLSILDLQADNEGCLCVLSHDELRTRREAVAGTEWTAIVLDEAETFATAESGVAQIVWDLVAPHRLVLASGSPERLLLQRPGILQFLQPGLWGTLDEFQRLYPAGNAGAIERFRIRLDPFVQRHTHSQVRPSLPNRTMVERTCVLESDQQRQYQAELRQARIRLARIQDESELDDVRADILAHLQQLRRITAGPGLAKPDQAARNHAKLEALDAIIQPLLVEGHSVRLVSPFPEGRDSWLEALGGHLPAGTTTSDGPESSRALDLLLRPAAGNIEGVDYVVALDPWWNPITELGVVGLASQRGQIVYRLLAKGTIEERIRSLQRVKAAITRTDTEQEATLAPLLDLDTIRELLL